MCVVVVTHRALRLRFHYVLVTFCTQLTVMAFPGATGENTPDCCSRKDCAITRQSFFPCRQLLSQEIKITFRENRKIGRDSYLSNALLSKPHSSGQFPTNLCKSITDCLPGPAGPSVGFTPLLISVFIYISVLHKR